MKRLAHVCIHATRLDETEKYYREALGLTKKFDFLKNGTVFGCYLHVGEGTYIEVFQADKNVGGRIDHFALEVENMDAAIERVKAAGYEITEKKLGADHAWQAWTTDPNGVRIELHEYTPESSQLTGHDCVVSW